MTPADRIIARAATLTDEEVERLWVADDMQGPCWDEVFDAACSVATEAEKDRLVGPGPTRDAILAVLVRDRISPEHFEILTRPWATVIGKTWEDRCGAYGQDHSRGCPASDTYPLDGGE